MTVSKIKSNYPNGFPNGVTIRNTPVTNLTANQVFWVSSVIGTNTGKGTYKAPYSTLAYALTQCEANKNDVIFLMPGHSEEIVSAAEVDVNVAGVSIIGLGNGENIPKYEFTTDVAASIKISADNVAMQNVRGVSKLASLTNPFHITGNDFYGELVFEDNLISTEAATAVLFDAAAGGELYFKHNGFDGGTTSVSPIVMEGATSIDIHLNCHGKYSTGVVEFKTTACSDIYVNGFVDNVEAIDGTKNVVDNVGGSTYFVNLEDGSAGDIFVGNSSSTPSAQGTPVGSEFWLKMPVVCNTITSASPVNLTTVAEGELAIIDVILKTDSTGLAGATNIQIKVDNADGQAVVLEETVANLGANKTITLPSASVSGKETILEVDKKIQIQATGSDGTGAGVVNVYVRLQRLSSRSTIDVA